MRHLALPLALLALVATALVGYGGTTPWAAALAHLLIALTVLVFAVATRRTGSISAYVLVGSWIGLGAMSLSIGDSVDPGLDALGALVASASVFLLAERVRGRRAERWLATGIASLAAVVSVWAIVRVPADGDALGPFGNANHLASWMLLPGALALAAFLDSDIRRRGRRESGFLWFLLCGAAAAAVAVTGSLGGAIAGAVAALVAVGGHRFVRNAEIRKAAGQLPVARLPRIASLSLLAAYVALAGALTVGSSLFPDGISVKSVGSESSVGMRWAVYGAASRAGLEHAPLGSGLGSFAEAFAAERPRGLPYGVRFAHNEPLHGWVELGVPFLLLALVSLTIMARRLPAALALAPSRFRIGAMAGLAGLAVHSLFDFPLHVPAIACVAAIGLGFAWRLPREGTGLRPQWSSAALASLGVLGIGLSGTQLVASANEELAVRAEAAGDFQAALSHVERGLRARPWRPSLRQLRADNLEYAAVFDGAKLGDSSVADARADAIAVAPRRANFRLQFARALAEAGDADRAREEIAAAKRLDPASPAPLLAAANLAFRSGDLSQAEEQIRAAIALHPGLASELARHAPVLWGRVHAVSLAEPGTKK